MAQLAHGPEEFPLPISSPGSRQCELEFRPKRLSPSSGSKREPANRDGLLGWPAHMSPQATPQAVAIYQQQIKLSSNDSIAWYGLAICNERMAEAASKSLAEMPGGRAYSKRLLGEFLLSRGDERLAQEAFGESATSDSAESPEAARQFESVTSLAEASRSAFLVFCKLLPIHGSLICSLAT